MLGRILCSEEATMSESVEEDGKLGDRAKRCCREERRKRRFCLGVGREIDDDRTDLLLRDKVTWTADIRRIYELM